MTRLALSHYDMWNDILTTNAGHVDEAMGALIERLESMRKRLRDGGLREDFEEGARLRRKAGFTSSSARLQSPERFQMIFILAA